MTKGRRLINALIGVVIIISGILMMFYPEDSYSIIATILGVSLTFFGLKTIFYYFTMARYMVGGKLVLYKGVIIFDMGFFLTTITDISRIYVMGYLFIIHIFAGAVDILKSGEDFKFGASTWRLTILRGLGNVILSITCLVNISSLKTVTFIYSIGLINSGIVHVVQSLRNTSSVYIVEV